MASSRSQTASEQSPLAETLAAFKEGYGIESHAEFKNNHGQDNLIDYNPMKLSTFRVCCLSKGTVLRDPVLLVEQLIITTIFGIAAFTVYEGFKMKGAVGKGDDMALGKWLDEQEPKMRAFATILTGLAAFLLSFYTSICVARWWTMRAGGVGGIKAATLDLEWMLCQNVTQDEEVLSAVRRYGRTSLMLIFLWRQQKLDNLREELLQRELLTDHEIDQLLKWSPNHCYHETIWAWQGQIIAVLYKEGKIKSDELFRILLKLCTDGRQAVQLVHTHLAVRVPMQYVHVLGLLVKMHNFVAALIMGIIFGIALRERRIIICIQTFARTLILPFLFNAILLINASLQDPFGGEDSDFPDFAYQAGLDKDCKGFVSATRAVPDWVAERSEKVNEKANEKV